jgi:filamentous hemagglutinin family protein
MRYSCCTIFALAIALGCEAVPAIAQMQPNAGTIVNPVGNRLDITGTQVSGKNQFHNFQTFNVNSGQTANFIPNNPNIQNILSRVTGGTPSQIQGMIQSANGVNLFLMNPSGILFGNGASLNVSGSFTATTANAIGFGNNLWFNAAGNNNTSALTGDPIQFAFTSANPGAIVNTGTLTLPANQSLNLIGGTVINTGTIATPGGNITIAAVEGGKAVQISAPGSILSYTLPIESINAINPAIENLVSLPELLTGNPLDNASGVEIRNGVVTLVRSQTPLQDRSGLAVVSGTLTSSKITVAGKTIAVVDPTIKIKEGTALFNADRRLLFEDQADDELKIGEFNNPLSQITFKANPSNGIIEAIDPKDKISVESGSINISGSTIKLGSLERLQGLTTEVGVDLSSTNDIQVGDITANGSINIISSNGNIKTGKLRSFNLKNPTTLTATIGNIEVESINSGSFGNSNDPTPLLLDIFAGGTFKAIGTSSNSYSFALTVADPSVLDFLTSKTDATLQEVKTAISNSPNASLFVLSPVSISSVGEIRIRYSGGGGIENKPLDGLTLQGKNARFEAGAKSTIGIGDPYLPQNKNNLFSTFIANPFSIVKNATYQPIVISEGASGTVGAIVRRVVVNGTITIGLQDQAFGVLPTKPIEVKPIEVKPIDINPIDLKSIEPKPLDQKSSNQNISTIDLETRNPSKLSSCPQTQTIAIAPIEATRSSEIPPNPSTSSVSKNPCLTDNNEDEILKILK